MAELKKFQESLEGKSVNTIKAYTQQYKKLRKLLEKDVIESSQDTIMDTVKAYAENPNSRQALLNIGILIRQANKYAIDKLLAYRTKLTTLIKDSVKENNKQLQEVLPSYEDLIEYLEKLSKSKKYREYIINYLMINLQVRNEDLLFKIVERKKDTTDTNFNYIWLSPTKATYIRNVYKTAKTYGQKVNVITDKAFLSALRQIIKKDTNLVPNEESLGYYIRISTLLGMGEGKYFKIIVDHFRDDFAKLKEISNNRGTALETIYESYNIKLID